MTTERIDIRVSERGAKAAASNIKGIGSSSLLAVVGVTAITSALSALSVISLAKFSADYESAMIGVQKTTNLGDAAIASLALEFRALSLEIPKSAEELANIGQIAGQLGISNSADILAFTETIAKIASVTDFTSEAAAESLARLSNIFDLPISQVENLGATLNELENTTTATASTLTNFVQRISVSGKQLGLSISDVAGFSATLVDMGFRAELAGTAVSKTFTEMISNTEVFAAQAGMSVEDFRAFIDRDAVGAVTAWAKSIEDLPTDQLIEAFDQVGIDGARAISVFGALTGNTKLLERNVKTANQAFEEGTSLQKEFETAVKAVNAQFQLSRNRVENLALGVGEGLLPAVSKIIEEFNIWIESLDFTENELRSIGAFIGGAMIDALQVGIDAFGAVKSGLELVAAVALKTTANLGLLLVPFAKLQDLITGNTEASDSLSLNLEAMNAAGDGLFDTAIARLKKFEVGTKNASIAIQDVFRDPSVDDQLIGFLGRLDARIQSGGISAEAASVKLQEFIEKANGAAGIAIPTGERDDLPDKESRALPFSQDELKSFRDLLADARTPAEEFALQLERVNELISRPGGLSPESGAVVIGKLVEEMKKAEEIDSPFSDIIDAGTLQGTELFLTQLEKINQFLAAGGNVEVASRALQEFSKNNEGAGESVEGLSAVLAAANRPIDDLHRQLERVQQLFLDGFIDDEQAALAIQRFTDKYNSSMASLEKTTDDSSKEIQSAINGLANSMESRMTDTFVGFLKGTNNMKEFFTQTIDEIIKQIIRLAVIKPIIDSLFPSGGGGAAGAAAGFLGSLFGGGGGSSSSGNVADLPTAPSFATGGIFKVGGRGGRDKQPVTLFASPNEEIEIRNSAQQRAMRDGGTGGGNVSVTVIVNSDGSSSSSSEGESNEFASQAGNIIKSTVMDMMRPSEPLGRALANRGA